MMIRAANRQRNASACVECAVCLLFLVPLLIGLWEVGRLVEVEQFLNNAVREGGRQASTGMKNSAGCQQDVINYLTVNGIPCSTSNVTITNITSSARNDPTTANQMDHFRVSVSIPFNSVRWVMLNQITPTTNLTAQVDFYSMRDVPLSINTSIPLN